MLEESVRPPALYPDDFGTAATTILRNTFGLTPTGITHDNCHSIYLSLVCLVDRLIESGVTICSLDVVTSDLECIDDSDSD